MMRHFKLTAASLIAGAALALSACGGGSSEANNTADNAMLGNDMNMVDPMAVETMNNGTDMNATGGTTGSTAGNSAGTAGTTGNTTGTTTGTGTGGTDAGGDTGGNAAGGTVNGM